ncbi:MAG TPA: hypothetical protein VIY07_09140 [Pseudolabrys sp.]
MRLSIVFDDNGTIMAASAGDEEADVPVPGPGENIRSFDIPDEIGDAELHQTVERVLTDTDASALMHLPARRETEDGPR